jgi:hypothetical protein
VVTFFAGVALGTSAGFFAVLGLAELFSEEGTEDDLADVFGAAMPFAASMSAKAPIKAQGTMEKQKIGAGERRMCRGKVKRWWISVRGD